MYIFLIADDKKNHLDKKNMLVNFFIKCKNKTTIKLSPSKK